MNFESALKAIRGNPNLRMRLGNKRIAQGQGFDIQTKDIWNPHTRKQSEDNNGKMTLTKHFIVYDNDTITYGLDMLRGGEIESDDWVIEKLEEKRG